MVPAHQRLRPGHDVGPRIDDRLIIQLQLAVRDRIAQILFQLPPVGRRAEQVAGEEAEPPPAAVFGGIKRQVGVADQFLAIHPVERADRHAHRCADRAAIAFHRIGLRQAGNDRLRQLAQLAAILDLGQDDLKLVAAQPADLLLVADDRNEPLGHLLENRVARRMAERVVDLLEAVEIDQQQGARQLARIAAGHLLGKQVGHVAAIEQPGEIVLAGVLLAHHRRLPFFGDIREMPQEAGEPAPRIELRLSRNGPPAHPVGGRGLHHHPVELRTAGQRHRQRRGGPLLSSRSAEHFQQGLAGNHPVMRESAGELFGEIGDQAVRIGRPEAAQLQGFVSAAEGHRIVLSEIPRIRGAPSSAYPVFEPSAQLKPPPEPSARQIPLGV